VTAVTPDKGHAATGKERPSRGGTAAFTNPTRASDWHFVLILLTLKISSRRDRPP
jgi:hypothetical protein